MNTAPKQAQAYYQAVSHLSQEDIVREHGSLVKRIAKHLMARFPPSVQIDDLIQAGMVGLLVAAKNYDASKGASFETYAGIRIRGSMLDELRKGDWVPRSVHRNARRISEAISVVENRLGGELRDVDVAQELGVTIQEYHHMLADTNSSRLFNFDDTGVGEEKITMGLGQAIPTPIQVVQKTKLNEKIIEGIKHLPEREKLLLSMYYHDALNFKEIGEVLGVTESRISQLHSQAMGRLRIYLKEWQGDTHD